MLFWCSHCELWNAKKSKNKLLAKYFNDCQTWIKHVETLRLCICDVWGSEQITKARFRRSSFVCREPVSQYFWSQKIPDSILAVRWNTGGRWGKQRSRNSINSWPAGSRRSAGTADLWSVSYSFLIARLDCLSRCNEQQTCLNWKLYWTTFSLQDVHQGLQQAGNYMIRSKWFVSCVFDLYRVSIKIFTYTF